MPIALVTRSARALSDSLNQYFRVFKGLDADNLWVRLPGGGSFEIRHSATNLPVLSVTDAGAAVSVANGSVTNAKLAPDAVTTDKIAPLTILDADVSAVAAIGVGKLSHVGAGNVLRSNGTANVAGQVVSGDIADGAVTNTKLGPNAVTTDKIANATILPADLAPGAALRVLSTDAAGTTVAWTQVPPGAIASDAVGPTTIVDGAVSSAKILDGTIANGDISTSAAIAVSKLAHVGAGNVLRSDGTTNVAGKIVSGDITDGTILNADINAAANIDGAKLLDGSVSSAKLSGASVPPDSITTTEIANGTILDVDINASANINGAKLLDASVPASKLSGSSVGPGSITTTEIANGTIADVDINSAAAIGLSKLAHVGANNLLKSNGTANVGGQLVNADVAAAAAVAYSKLNLAASIASGDLVLGASIQATTVQGGNSDPQTASGTPVDLQNMTRTLTTLAGSLALITFDGVFSSTAAAPYLIVDLMQDGVVAVRRQFQLPAGVAQIVAYSYLTTVTLTAAAHTWKMQWWVAGGTMTVTALGILRGLTVVELKRPTLV